MNTTKKQGDVAVANFTEKHGDVAVSNSSETQGDVSVGTIKVVLNLTPDAAKVVDGLVKVLGLRSRPELFRRALTVLRIHVDADKEGRDVVLINRQDDKDRQLVSAKYIGG